MTQELRNMRIRQVSLVDKGATGRTFALLKRDAGAGSARNVRKDVPTFASLQASGDLATWLPDALSALAAVIDAAIAGVPPELEASVTPEIRLQAVRNSAADFTSQLLDRVAQVIVMEDTYVAKREPSIFGKGWL
jgi:hypothetical protein